LISGVWECLGFRSRVVTRFGICWAEWLPQVACRAAVHVHGGVGVVVVVSVLSWAVLRDVLESTPDFSSSLTRVEREREAW
jgi:hypothetical protein